jgi:hypothetical protein
MRNIDIIDPVSNTAGDPPVPVDIQCAKTVDLFHNSLQGLQGGTMNERYHLTKAQYDALGGQISGFVDLTTDQDINGVKTFLQSIIIPDATQTNQAVTLGQLQTVIGDITAPDQILSGLALTIDGSNVDVAPGSWRIGGTIYSTSSVTVLALEAQDATESRTDTVYVLADGTINLASGDLSADPADPDIPDNSLIVGDVLITPTSVTTIPPPPTGFVDLTTNQIVRGVKTFRNNIRITATINPANVYTVANIKYLIATYQPIIELTTIGSGEATFDGIHLNIPTVTAGVWGQITGTLSSQTDLTAVLAGLVPYTGAINPLDMGNHSISSSSAFILHTDANNMAVQGVTNTHLHTNQTKSSFEIHNDNGGTGATDMYTSLALNVLQFVNINSGFNQTLIPTGATLTGNVTITMPPRTGTLALLSDLDFSSLTKQYTLQMEPIGVNEVTFLFEVAGNITSVVVSGASNVKLKTGSGSTYPGGTQTYPYAYANGDRVYVTYTYTDPLQASCNLILHCLDT